MTSQPPHLITVHSSPAPFTHSLPPISTHAHPPFYSFWSVCPPVCLIPHFPSSSLPPQARWVEQGVALVHGARLTSWILMECDRQGVESVSLSLLPLLLSFQAYTVHKFSFLLHTVSLTFSLWLHLRHPSLYFLPFPRCFTNFVPTVTPPYFINSLFFGPPTHRLTYLPAVTPLPLILSPLFSPLIQSPVFSLCIFHTSSP